MRPSVPAFRWTLNVREVAIPWLYLLGVIAAEAALRAGARPATLVIYAVLLIAALNHAALRGPHRRALFLGVAVIVVERILDAALNLARLAPVDGFFVVAVPTLVAVVLAIRAAGYTRRDVGLTLNAAAVANCLVGIPLGLVIGLAYYRTVTPTLAFEPSASASSTAVLVVIAVASSIVEELSFRGLLQGATIRQLGSTFGILYVAALYTVTATSGSPQGTLVVLPVAIGLGVITTYLRSVIPAVTLHASINIGAMLLGPMLLRQAGGG